MRERIIAIVADAVRELNNELKLPELSDPGTQTLLYGNGAPLDSLSLVSLVADIEERLSDELNQDVVLADERAMSRNHSPFRQIGGLAAYIEELLEKEETPSSEKTNGKG